MANTNEKVKKGDKTINEIFDELKSSKNGMSDSEAKARLEKYGYNEIIEKRQSRILKFLKKFYGPIPFMLEIVMVITFAINDMKDFYVILALLIFNAIVSFIEENKADNAIELLKKRLSVSARVLRSGIWKVVEARELVKGDIIRIRIGDIVPADVRIIEESSLEIDQSILTGESMPVKKGTGDLAYSGSIVREGEATGIVVATGYETYYGHTTQLVQIAGAKSHLESAILKITRYLISFDAIIAVIVFVFGVLVIHESYAIMVPFILIILIASVPVALPAAFTVTMALGTKRLADKSVLVTKLDSIEETSTLNTICFDKTGTLTENKMEVKEVFPIGKHTTEEVLRAALLASRKEDNDPIDNAVIQYAKERSISATGYVIKEFYPFQPKTKMSSAKVLYKNKIITAMKGAYSVIQKAGSIDIRLHRAMQDKIDEFSKYNYRTIAVASGQKKPEVLGVIALYDKPRAGVDKLIDELSSLSIDIKMLTGDNLQIAKEIAKEVGIKKSIVDFSELKGGSTAKIENAIESSGGFAEIFPEDKYLIVKALQKSNHRVGMTGDGVNDAPALKQAEVGIAVENATDVAKSVAGIVLIKNGLNTIVDAIKESRRIFERMMTYAMVKIVRVIQIVLFIMVAFMLLKQIPILPFELILLIFTNDIVNIAISTDNAEYSKKPDTWNIKSISYTSLTLGAVFLLLTLIFIPVGRYIEPNIGAFQTFIFFMFVVTDKLLIYSLRNRKRLWSTRPSRWLVISSLVGVLAGALISYYGFFVTPISLFSLFVVIAISFAIIIVFDFVKSKVYKGAGIRHHFL
ncbi:MAG: plasma-membrane proton-efflux P-type ATPase [Candidatus Micrarchaeia archaeon]